MISSSGVTVRLTAVAASHNVVTAAGLEDVEEEIEDVDQSPNSVPILLDLAFASNV